MDTVSLLVYRRVCAARHWIPLVALASIALTLLVAGAPSVVDALPQPAAEPLLAPFRWFTGARNMG
ncbi:MAG: hypothetical protein LH650_01820 [Chloroflexi bacterium]|nr:hypothetical protein [Chloroflexota bacterium]